MLQIRDYTENDELAWLQCRVLSFLDCSYFNDVLTKREIYNNEAICLVAERNGRIVGLLDIEIEPGIGSLCVAGDQKGAVIWHLAVLPEFRREQIASKLWEEGKTRLNRKDIKYCEVWTQEDIASNYWYRQKGFRNVTEQNWLRCYARPSKSDWFLNRERVGEIFGVEEMIFKVSTARRDEVAEYCYRIDEVRLYVAVLG